MGTLKPGLVFAVDPGPTQSGAVLFDAINQQVLYAGTKRNDLLMQDMRAGYPIVVFEKIVNQGQLVGKSVLETAYESGRLSLAAEESGSIVHRLTRTEIKQHLGVRRGDSHIRQALIVRWGGKLVAIGKKGAYGALHGVIGHAWSALAVAVTWADRAQSSGAIPPRQTEITACEQS